DCTPRQGAVLVGSNKVSFRAEATGAGERLDQVQLRILSEEPSEVPHPNDNRPVISERPPDTAVKDYSFDWDTILITPYNGRYKLEVYVRIRTVTGNTQERTFSRGDLKVNNPPSTPGRPKVVSSTSAGHSVSWPASDEPDVRTYTLYRARTDSASETPDADDFKRLLDTPQNEVFVSVTEPGAYWYRVRATRRSVVTPDTGISSTVGPRSIDPGVVTAPTPGPDGAPPATRTGPRVPGGGARTPLAAKPLPRLSAKPAPVPDAPFSTVLDYGDIAELEDGEGDEMGWGDEDRVADRREAAEEARRRTLPAAIGLFMFSAWAVLTRSRVLT
ncbi:MAG TPA: hypothetical protein VM840_07975, partial [Actinomycetota bacterium]|nr:hypothetical protein [Actinomycetota bacterium]